MFNEHDISRNACQLFGEQASQGYDWWWHSFTARNAETGEEKPFFIEFFLCNPALGGDEPVFGQLPENKQKGIRPSYLMVKAGAWGKDAVQLHRFYGCNIAWLFVMSFIPFGTAWVGSYPSAFAPLATVLGGFCPTLLSLSLQLFRHGGSYRAGSNTEGYKEAI